MKNVFFLALAFLSTSLFVLAQSDSSAVHHFNGIRAPIGLYVSAVVLGILGQVVAMLTMYSTLKAKAKATNVIFGFASFWSDEWPNQIRNLCVIVIAVMLIPIVILKQPAEVWLIRPIMPIIGFSGMTIFLQYAGVANKALNAAAGFKAEGFDKSTGNTQAPTPATKP